MARASKKDPPAIQQLTQLRAKILQLAVQGKLVSQNATDEPASVLLESIAAEHEQLIQSKQIRQPKPLPPIAPDDIPYALPQGWEWARLGALVASMDSGGSPRCMDRPPQPGEWGVLKTSAVNSGRFLPQEAKALPADQEPKVEAVVSDGDYVLTRGSGSIEWMARGSIVRNPPERLMMSDLHIRLRFADHRLSLWWALAANSRAIRDQLEAQASGSSTMRKVSKSKLRMVDVAVPPLAEQQRIVAKVDELMAAIDELETYLRRVEALRPQILQLAAQGKLVPQDASDEPTSVLLERIASEREQLVKSKHIKKPKPLPSINPDEVPHELPQGWEWARLGAITTNRDSERIPVKVRDRTSGPYAYYGASGIVDFVDRYLFDGELLLVGEDGARFDEVGASIAYMARGKFWVNNHAHVLDGISPEFLAFLALAINGRGVRDHVTGTTVPKLTQGRMALIPLAIPPLAEQRRIVEKLGELLAAIDAVQGRAHAEIDAADPIVELVTA